MVTLTALEYTHMRTHAHVHKHTHIHIEQRISSHFTLIFIRDNIVGKLVEFGKIMTVASRVVFECNLVKIDFIFFWTK